MEMFKHLERIEVAVRHPYRMIVDALASHLSPDHRFKLIGMNDESHGCIDIQILDPQAALNILEGSEPKGSNRIIVLSVTARESEVQRAMQGGAFGYLVLNSPMSEVDECLQAVARGQRYICREAAHSMVSSMSRCELTPREQTVLSHLANGLCNKSIARELNVADGTVKTHVRAILAKLGAASRTQAARYALERGLVEQAH